LLKRNCKKRKRDLNKEARTKRKIKVDATELFTEKSSYTIAEK